MLIMLFNSHYVDRKQTKHTYTVQRVKEITSVSDGIFSPKRHNIGNFMRIV